MTNDVTPKELWDACESGRIGRNVRLLRAVAEMTQEVLAERVGVSFQQVHHWERGRRHPRVSHIEKLAEVLGVSVGDLVRKEGKAILP